MELQLDLLKDNSEIGLLKQEMILLEEKSENLRRGLFVRFQKLSELYEQTKEEIKSVRAELKNIEVNQRFYLK